MFFHQNIVDLKVFVSHKKYIKGWSWKSGKRWKIVIVKLVLFDDDNTFCGKIACLSPFPSFPTFSQTSNVLLQLVLLHLFRYLHCVIFVENLSSSRKKMGTTDGTWREYRKFPKQKGMEKMLQVERFKLFDLLWIILKMPFEEYWRKFPL